ncbi:helix-turn-helix transcriptional regulator [Wenzhouxiangella sp. XN201]|uniref:winged helix-turn-helix transcriptional regulator n=1 Tax=Wenzhouxiangella sp. XN201 TaxID=2710755 RepID=UPI0013CD582C|nr:helix-turn-helix domain-containing protein [Wenzhouxiangella sp. XN201]NEZ04317.1 helix-turn-helix transcriptional regulator [Wenzhouxiangella sp. XN201]
MSKDQACQGNCPIARVTALLGDGWSLMIIREAFLGSSQFNDFEKRLGIARNILSDRLRKLVEAGLLKRKASQTDRRVVEYKLTESGRALFPVLIALSQWVEEHLGDPCHSVRYIERATGEEIQRIRVLSTDGRALDVHELAMLPGPDADPALRARLVAAIEQAESRPARAGS